MKPSSKDLLPFINNRKEAAEKFAVSEKTVSRWMKSYGIYNPKKNYGCKLDIIKAREIRKKYEQGTEIKDLAEEYQVTFSAVSRIIRNITYSENTDTAEVSVIYNIV